MAAIAENKRQRHWTEKASWALIYGGLLTLTLGLSVGRTDNALGWSFVAPGAVAAAVGVVLIWVRSRLKVSE